MPSISKIRLTNVVYEEGNKRYNDEIFLFDGHNGAILLENGGGKTVLIQTALQAILPHVDLADRKIKNTLLLESAPAHIAIEWIINDKPRRYVVTAVSLFMTKHGLDSLRYVYEYDPHDPNGIEGIPFVREGKDGKRTAERGEIQDYYGHMRDRSFYARTFPTIKDYKTILEEQYHIISSEWESIVKINSSEGGVEAFFDDCKSTTQLFDRLLIPTVEASIVGHDANMFADMFEQQHASLKHYKKLKESIEENQKIQAQLEDYVSVYEHLHNRELTYEKVKERTKGVWIETKLHKEKSIAAQMEAGQKLAEWKANETLHQIKTDSFHIAVEEKEFKRLEEQYHETLAQELEKEEGLAKQQKDFYSLKLAKLKGEEKNQEDRLHYIEAEIEKLEKTEELDALSDELDETKRALLGYFLEEKEKLNREKQGLTFELNPITTEIDRLTAQQTKLTVQEKETHRKLSKIDGLIEQRTKDMDRLKQQLLANPEQEKVKEALTQWKERHQFLDDEIIRLLQEEKQIVAEMKEAEALLEVFRDEHSQAENVFNKISFQLDELHQAQTALIQQLGKIRVQWASLEDVYLKQDSIETRIIEQLERLRAERNQLLYRERIAYRFVDDYGSQDLFFADTFLEQQLSSWKNQFDYIVTGVEYVETLDEETKSGFSLWPQTLITTAKSKAQVIEKLKLVSDRLQFPIIVLSTEEAVMIHQENYPESWVAPQHWEDNQEESYFHNWKQQLSNRAKEITILREQQEREIKRWEEVFRSFQQFLLTYPFEKLTQLKEESSKATKTLESLATRIQQTKELINEIGSLLSTKQTMVRDHREEIQGLGSKIEKGYQYLQYEKEVEEEGKKHRAAAEQLQQISKELKRFYRLLKDLEEQKKELEKQIDSKKILLQLVDEDEEYKEVRMLSPVYSGDSKQVIKLKLHELDLKISRINRTQGEWEARREGVLGKIEDIRKQMSELIADYSPLDERPFPTDGDLQIDQLKERIASLKSSLKKLTGDVRDMASKKDHQHGKWQTISEQFQKSYSGVEVIQFILPLEEVATEIGKEKQELLAKKDFIDQETVRIQKEVKGFDEAERWLEKYIESHHFNAPDIDGQKLSSDEIIEFTYKRMAFLKGLTDELTKAKEEVDLQQHQVAKAKSVFRAFCDKSISDVKMRKMALNGIEYKTNYHDIVEFKKNMMTSVERASSYANEHIRQKDAELQAFINQIHTHLLTLVEELRQLPKKTKVKILDDWKQVFTFMIPEWDEEVGKTRIRDYMEWMLEQLESDRYLNEQGIQDDGKVRKEIETWLQSKQLLQMVMNNEVMKVSCRKVTNDNKVSTRSYSWEQSNIWSGGEKWSKNMTLFLGILNYVAEKKQHIQPNMKRHRAVIMDNPFGKASSDHVLSPVFFVADQLGFQIIALTAHAEGKFLQDYFPVIYSCRLRASTDPTIKIMTKEKWLHHAYFQDHEPKTIERLGEVEQLALFE